MKKLFILILIGLVFFVATPLVYAQTATEEKPIEVAPQPTTVAQYQLAYPGILPDNPLYTLKVVRDRIIGFLISDSIKKTEFNLLESDKRLNAGMSLAKKGKYVLAESTISKGENYFEEALSSLKEARKEKKDVVFLAEKMLNASDKHETELIELEKKAPALYKKNFVSLLERVQRMENEVKSFIPQQQTKK